MLIFAARTGLPSGTVIYPGTGMRFRVKPILLISTRYNLKRVDEGKKRSSLLAKKKESKNRSGKGGGGGGACHVTPDDLS